MPGDPTLADVIREHLRAGLATVHTSLPAVVVAYDPALQRATVQPTIRARVDDPTLGVERPTLAPPPPLPNLPVVWPSGAAGTWALTGPLSPGDPVTVVVQERSTDEWRHTGVTAPVGAPVDARRWDLTDAVVVPGGRVFVPGPAGPLPATAYDPAAVVLSGATVKLGSSSATDAVALATLVLAELQKIQAAIAIWTPVPNDGGASLKAVFSGITFVSPAATLVRAL